jgi:hypothetical protein
MARRRLTRSARALRSQLAASAVWYPCYRAATPDRHQGPLFWPDGRCTAPYGSCRRECRKLHLPSLNEPR